MSMLEETQTAERDGYKTPNAFEQAQIAGGQMTDQFALALLRLQHGLDQTVGRLNKLEIIVKQSLDGLNLLQNQTRPKQRLPSSCHQKAPVVCGVTSKFTQFLRQLGVMHWFYLSYPIVVYMILRRFEKRRRNNSQPPW